MQNTTLGHTKLRVSVAGLGAGGFSRLGLKTGKTEDEAARLVLEGVDLGVNFIDTAAAYGTEGRADQRRPPPLPRVVGIAWSVFLEYVDRALLFELRCDVDGGPTKECAAEASEDEGNKVAVRLMRGARRCQAARRRCGRRPAGRVPAVGIAGTVVLLLAALLWSGTT
jgi:hypothetical protein